MSTTARNSYEIAEAHGLVWIGTYHHSGGYDMATAADGSNAAWYVHAAPGKVFCLQGKEEIPLGSFRRRNTEDQIRSKAKPFATFDDAAAWCERTYGIVGWKRDRFGGYHPNPKGTDRPCGESMSSYEGLASTHGWCDKKRKPGEDLCGIHLNAIRTREKNQAAADEHSSRSDENQRAAQDVVDELAEFGIEKAKPHYHSDRSFSKSGYTGDVIVDGEKLKGLLTQLRMAREILGDDMPESGAW